MRKYILSLCVAITFAACTNEGKQKIMNGEVKETGLPAAADPTPNPHTAMADSSATDTAAAK